VGLAERGARVVLGDRGDASETIALIADGGHEAVPVTLDVSDPSSIEVARDRVAEELGHVDILVNNAGTFEAATWDDLDFDLWQRVMAAGGDAPALADRQAVFFRPGRISPERSRLAAVRPRLVMPLTGGLRSPPGGRGAVAGSGRGGG
jgi:NAD(P)-dependent dehydrogenase (short-subunit alcohol dehydrogenase family)